MTKYIGPKTADENVATQADKLSLSSATPDALTPDQAGAAGTATTAARSDHQHEILAGAAGTILPDDVAAEGSSTSFARADHTHAITAAAPSANLTASTTNTEGTATSFARSDHTHAIAAASAGTITGTNAEGTSTSFARADHNHAIATAAAGTILPDDAAAPGSAASFSRSDHTHAITAAAPATNLTASTTNAEGNATSFARSNHTHAIDTAAPSANLSATTTNAVGTSANLARSDHSHAITTAAPGTISPDDAAAAGTSASLARADHTHAIAAASAGTITGTNAEGTSTSFARADHNHAYGALSIPNSALALGPTYETALPASPVDGQEIYYAADATNGVIWHLRYRSGATGSYKWEFIGGGPLTNYNGASLSSSLTAFTWADISTAHSITVPLAGDYLAQYSTQTYRSGGGQTTYTGIKVGSTEATVDTNTAFTNAAADIWGVHSQTRRINGISASTVLTLRFQSTVTTTIFRYNTNFTLIPIRLG